MQLTEFIFLGEFQSIGLWECRRCGAAVSDQARHLSYHDAEGEN